ncbi:MAG: HlyD family efflux transporter periplasmic adaptor subunit [Bacteroidales bacterium]
MKKTIIISGIILVVAIIGIIIFQRISSKKDVLNLYAKAEKGSFDIVVTTTGELQAENSMDIRGPEFTESRNVRSMDIKIQDLVAEGTEVKSGDYVATLDRTSFDNTLKDELDRLNTYETNLEVKILDTAVTLSNLRDNIKNLNYSVEEAAITLQQSKFEPPTTIRQAEISLDKAKRNLEQALRGYTLRVEQAKSDVRNQQRQISEQRQRVADIQKLLSRFIITAPSDGMVIYKRDRTGTKRKVGSSISPWDPVVATLPDMTTMISKTYVNEIDVSKIKPQQKVDIVVDAFPERAYTGVVTSVANIGEQLPNTDAKVFEVIVKVDGSDPALLRPSMTTGNKIVTKTINDVIYIPLECVQAGTDSIPFVYTRKGNKQVVLLGESNENNVIVEKGLEEGEVVYLSTPEDPTRFRLVGEDLIPVIKERERLKKEEELKLRREAEEAAANKSRMGGFGGGGFGQGGMNFQMMGGGGNNQGGGMQNMQRGTGGATNQAGQTNATQRMGGNFGGGQGGMRGDTAMRRRIQQMRESGDTAGMRRMFQQFRNGQQGGGQRDTSARRRMNTQQQNQQPVVRQLPE